MKGSTVVFILDGSIDFEGAYDKTEDLNRFPWVGKLNDFICEVSQCELNQLKFVDNFYTRLYQFFSDVTDNDHSIAGPLMQQFSEKFPKAARGKDEADSFDCLMAEPYRDGFVYIAVWNNEGESLPIECQVVKDQPELYSRNAFLIGKYPLSTKDFISRSKLLFNNLDFHEDIEAGLKDLKAGTYDQFSLQFVYALRTLHEAYEQTKQEVSQNDLDLQLINSHSAIVASTPIACTRESKSKSKFYFDLGNTGEPREYICEFHLKLDRFNDGRIIDQFEKIDGKDLRKNNRLYFGMPMYEGSKRFIVAHIGKHL
jgi:hypothetical protein